MKKEELGKVVVGISGGVDSAFSAYLIKKQGYEVIGVFLKFWKEDVRATAKALKDAQKVAKSLGIPLQIVDARAIFRKKIVGEFLKDYARGLTPNPCVICNEEVKFKILFSEMKKYKADHLATGHYARLRREIPNSKSQFLNKFQIKNSKLKIETSLFEARDGNKDQSYFLYRLPQKYLARIIFPLGEYKKEDVRKLAKKNKIPIYDKGESQDICFLCSSSPETFLKKNIRLKKGKIIDQSGKILGKHEGLPLYTIGQRRGIKIGGTGPYYVAKKDLKKNQLVVSNNSGEDQFYAKKIGIKSVRWPAGKPEMPAEILIQTRYREEKVRAIIKSRKTNNRGYIVDFEKPQRAIAPGQSAVFYSKKEEVIGGGIIT
jgi:tRNA-uridine 2-sulfurtransferase